MTTVETAEAIIVVGPLLWKCVNCNLLLSREHSIDDHLASHHESALKPNEPTIAQCGLVVCGCRKSSSRFKLEGKDSKKNQSHQKRVQVCVPSDPKETSKPTTTDSPHSSPMPLLPGGNEGATDSKNTADCSVEDSIMTKCKDDIIADKENDTFPENKNENEEEDSVGKNNETQSSDGIVSESDTQKKSSQISIVSKLEENEDFASEEMEEKATKHKLDNVDNQNTRKSRRSNKGKNPLYHAYEMGLS